MNYENENEVCVQVKSDIRQYFKYWLNSEDGNRVD